MSQQEMDPQSINIRMTFSDASHLPIPHANAMSLRHTSDEFYFILGVAQPPDELEVEAIKNAGVVVAQPLFRFAISRDTMEQFLGLMADQYEKQTALMKQRQMISDETTKEEARANE